MSAYIMIDVEITDADLYGQFREQVTPVVESHGGKFVVRGGAIEIVLGDWSPNRVALIEFGSIDQAHSFLSSPGYRALDDIRDRSSNLKMVVLEGV
ncbi:MAG: DUF1330 domain-containing protein [Chloroflexota bacterium]|nr:DUF1330 domain-containing protein [Chloroflexota bacterium]MDE2970135.1 DUF1330 domain-containing protein [Chloroflexota bacterium]